MRNERLDKLKTGDIVFISDWHRCTPATVKAVKKSGSAVSISVNRGAHTFGTVFVGHCASWCASCCEWGTMLIIHEDLQKELEEIGNKIDKSTCDLDSDIYALRALRILCDYLKFNN